MYKLSIDANYNTTIRQHDELAGIIAGQSAIGIALLTTSAENIDLPNVLTNNSQLILKIDNFADGRFFSLARSIHEQEKYTGEIIAYGEFIDDQIAHMHRLGINSFLFDNLADAERAESVASAQLQRINYQSLYLEENHVYND